jgi:hypothetical protein
MINIRVAFEPHFFENRAIEQMKNDIESRLAGHDFTRLSIAFTKDFRREIVLQFRGDDQDVARARRLLDTY